MVHFTTEQGSTQYRKSGSTSIPWSSPLSTGNPVGILWAGFSAAPSEHGLSSCQTNDGKRVWDGSSKGPEGRVTGLWFPGTSSGRYPPPAVLLAAEGRRRITTESGRAT